MPVNSTKINTSGFVQAFCWPVILDKNLKFRSDTENDQLKYLGVSKL